MKNKCACGLEHEWLTLERLGEQDDGVEILELRQCTCGSTMAVVVGPSRPDERECL